MVMPILNEDGVPNLDPAPPSSRHLPLIARRWNTVADVDSIIPATWLCKLPRRFHSRKATQINPIRIGHLLICGRTHDLAFSTAHGICSQTAHETVAGNEQEKGYGQTNDDTRHLDRD